MHISGFMVPASKVAVASPNDTLKAGMDQMLEKKIGAIVVLNESDPEKLDEPVGILTKTDFLTAYNNGLTLETKLKEVMSTELKTVDENMSKDNASKFFEKSKLHHALVVNKDGKFVGIISSWDIAAENARDNRAWPWFRTEDGKVHAGAGEHTAGHSGGSLRDSHTFLDYVDSIRDLHYVENA